MGKVLSNYATINLETLKQEQIQLEKQIKKTKLLKEKLEQYFQFEIPDYIILDIADNEEYQHFCLLVNVAVVNKRLTSENGNVLKQGIKELFSIKTDYDKLQPNMLFS